MFVRKENGLEQLVLLDHGLYRELDESFRNTFCGLWKALLTQNMKELEQRSEELGVGMYAKYFPLIFTGRALNSSTRFDAQISREERNQLRAELKQFNISDVQCFSVPLRRALTHL